MTFSMLAFLSVTSVIGLAAFARGLLLGAGGKTTLGLTYALTGYLTLFLAAICIAQWSGGSP